MAEGRFELYRDASEKKEWRFRLVDGSGDNVLKSEGYGDKSGCTNGIESVKENAPKDGQYERLPASDGRHYFNLKASNGEIIGKGDLCDTEAERDAKIETVKRIAPVAPVEEK